MLSRCRLVVSSGTALSFPKFVFVLAPLSPDMRCDHARYAEEQIKGYASEGKNIIPLIKELRSFRKRVLE